MNMLYKYCILKNGRVMCYSREAARNHFFQLEQFLFNSLEILIVSALTDYLQTYIRILQFIQNFICYRQF